MEYRIFKLKNISPTHIGQGRDAYDTSNPTIDSDTMMSALASIWVNSYGDENLLDFLQSTRLSTAFPFINSTFFLPRPLGPLNIIVEDVESEKVRKKIKKLQFVELSYWLKLSKGDQVTIHNSTLHDAYLCDIDHFEPPTKHHVVERVYVPHEGDSTPFFFDWIYFSPNSGLYVIANCTNEDYAEKLNNLFKQLGEQGIGTDRSVGGGHFDIEESSLSVDTINNSSSQILLSSYIPSIAEIKEISLKDSRYKLLKKGGYMAGSCDESIRHLRRKTIHMFSTGSLISNIKSLDGNIIDCKPNWNSDIHHVYRCGKPIALPFNTFHP